jgi:hypothetical protein
MHRTAGLPIPYADERALAVIRGEEVYYETAAGRGGP